MIMEFVQDEPHAYTSARLEYQFNKRDQSNYEILYVRGFKVLDSGSVNHVFIQGVDYELRDQYVYWLDGDRPSVPPPSSNLTQNWFYITYVYEKRPEQTIKSSVYPFLKPNGVFTSILDAFGSQIRHVYEKRRGMVRSRSLSYSLGTELDMLGDWYGVTRLDGETDISFRARLFQFFSTYLSSGNKEAISNVIEAVTGTVPTILELWENTSYYNYDPADPSIQYVYSSKTNPPAETESLKIAHYWDFTNTLNTFYVILPLSVINEYGISTLKDIIDESKASGVVGYLGYLVNEDFAVDASNWEERAWVLGSGDTSSGAWSVTGGKYRYLHAPGASAATNGLSVIDDTVFTGCDDWQEYQVTCYAQDALANSGNKVGIMIRWGDETDGYGYFLGFSAFADKAYAYKYTVGGWAEITTGGVDTKSLTAGTNYHLRVVIKGSTARFYLDNDLVYDSVVEDDAADWDDLTSGRVGFCALTNVASGGSGNDVDAYFDDMVVVI